MFVDFLCCVVISCVMSIIILSDYGFCVKYLLLVFESVYFLVCRSNVGLDWGDDMLYMYGFAMFYNTLFYLIVLVGGGFVTFCVVLIGAVVVRRFGYRMWVREFYLECVDASLFDCVKVLVGYKVFLFLCLLVGYDVWGPLRALSSLCGVVLFSLMSVYNAFVGGGGRGGADWYYKSVLLNVGMIFGMYLEMNNLMFCVNEFKM